MSKPTSLGGNETQTICPTYWIFFPKKPYNNLMIKDKYFEKLNQFIKIMLYEFRRFLKIIIVMFLGVLIGGFLLLILSNIALGTTR